MAKKKDSVRVVVLTLAERDGWITPELFGWLAAMKAERARVGDGREIQLSYMYERKPYDCVRNELANEFLDSSCDWVLMLDNDMIPPPNLLDMIDGADDRMDILVPQFFAINGYNLKLSIHHRGWIGAADQMASLINLVWKFLGVPDGQVPAVPDGAKQEEWAELECAGSAAMFVRRRVFERLDKPFFRYVCDEQTGHPAVSEDFYFCLKARAAGFRIWGNRKFGVDHMKTVSLGTLAHIFGWSPLKTETPAKKYQTGDPHPTEKLLAFVGYCDQGHEIWTSTYRDTEAPHRLAKLNGQYPPCYECKRLYTSGTEVAPIHPKKLPQSPPVGSPGTN